MPTSGTFTILPSLVSSKSINWAIIGPDVRPGTNEQFLNALNGIGFPLGGLLCSYLGTDDPKPDGLFTARLDFFGDCIQLDGVGPLISYAGLPAGFTALSAQIYLIALTGSPSVSGYVEANAGNQVIIPPSANFLEGTFIYDFVTFPKPTMLDIYSNGAGLGFTVPNGSLFEQATMTILGTYTLISFTLPTLETPGPLGPGDHVILTSPLVDGLDFTHVASVSLQYVDEVGDTKVIPDSPLYEDSPSYVHYIYSPYVYIPLIAQPITPILYELVLPEYIPEDIPSGEIEIIVVGDGTQFSGSLSLGTFTILYENASGIYKIVKDKTSDTIYDRLAGEGETAELKIPNPFVETGYIGG